MYYIFVLFKCWVYLFYHTFAKGVDFYIAVNHIDIHIYFAL